MNDVNPTTTSAILVVDDELYVCNALQRLLRGRFGDVVACQSAIEGLKVLQQKNFGVVIADYLMPEMDGVTFLSKVKKFDPQIQTILITGRADKNILARAINEAGISRFVDKPWQNEQIRAVISNAMGQYELIQEMEALTQLKNKQNEELKRLNQELEDRADEKAKELSEVYHQWHRAIKELPDPWLLLGEDFIVHQMNHEADKLTSSPDEYCYSTMFGRSEPCEGCPAIELFKDPSLDVAEGQVQVESRMYNVRCTSYFQQPGKKKNYMVMYHDVTLEHQLQQQMFHNEKMMAIGRLAGGVAHEINNPLHGIISFTQLARRQMQDADKLNEYIQTIEQCALRCKNIVEGLLSLSRRSDTRSRTAVDLNKIVNQALGVYAPLIKKENFSLDINLEVTPLELVANPTELQQVVVNLLQNAIDAVSENGTITLTTQNEGKSCVLMVTDDGPGVATDNISKIFEPFFTTKPEGKGTGLGLSITHTIVSDLDGKIEVASNPNGCGSVFKVSFPKFQPGMREKNNG